MGAAGAARLDCAFGKRGSRIFFFFPTKRKLDRAIAGDHKEISDGAVVAPDHAFWKESKFDGAFF